MYTIYFHIGTILVSISTTRLETTVLRVCTSVLLHSSALEYRQRDNPPVMFNTQSSSLVPHTAVHTELLLSVGK